MPQIAMISGMYTASQKRLHVVANLSKEINGPFLIHDDEQLQRWKKQFTRALNHIRSSEAPPLVDEMASHRNMRIRTVSSSKSEIISTINALKRSEATGFYGHPVVYRCTCSHCRFATFTCMETLGISNLPLRIEAGDYRQEPKEGDSF